MLASGTPVKFWRTGIELPRIRARAKPQKKNRQKSLCYPCLFRGAINKFAVI
jgi:hypothetical protein